MISLGRGGPNIYDEADIRRALVRPYANIANDILGSSFGAVWENIATEPPSFSSRFFLQRNARTWPSDARCVTAAKTSSMH